LIKELKKETLNKSERWWNATEADQALPIDVAIALFIDLARARLFLKEHDFQSRIGRPRKRYGTGPVPPRKHRFVEASDKAPLSGNFGAYIRGTLATSGHRSADHSA
jgi:hypothetical protein